jgi:predicted PurR-regulated permease PerM
MRTKKDWAASFANLFVGAVLTLLLTAVIVIVGFAIVTLTYMWLVR